METPFQVSTPFYKALVKKYHHHIESCNLETPEVFIKFENAVEDDGPFTHADFTTLVGTFNSLGCVERLGFFSLAR